MCMNKDLKISEINERITELRTSLADLSKRWPAHSVKPQMIDEMEKIEEEISELSQFLSGTKNN